MAISLKNVDDRLKKLESGGASNTSICLVGKHSGNFLCGTNPAVNKIGTLMSSSGGKVTVPAGNYLCMLGFYASRGTNSPAYTYIKLLNGSTTVIDFGGYHQDNYSSGGILLPVTFSTTSSVTLQPWCNFSGTGSGGNNVFCVLKLYYNFSYNIIREFLSKIKIKLKSFLEALPKKGR